MSTLVTAIILTKNEAANLPRCIHSLQWCDSVIVLDSGSTDDTEQTALASGARFYRHIPPSPFRISDQRNWALDNCEVGGRWVLFIDADETISPELASEISRRCSDKTSSLNAFELTPRYLFWGTWLKRTQGYPNWHHRLLKAGEVRFSGGVWEHFAQPAQIGRIELPYDHYANSKGFADWVERHNRYSTWDAQRTFEFLTSGQVATLQTERKLALRKLAAYFWPLRPFARFFNMYLARAGFTEGPAALVFCWLYFIYEWMIVVKIIELFRQRHNLPL